MFLFEQIKYFIIYYLRKVRRIHLNAFVGGGSHDSIHSLLNSQLLVPWPTRTAACLPAGPNGWTRRCGPWILLLPKLQTLPKELNEVKSMSSRKFLTEARREGKPNSNWLKCLSSECQWHFLREFVVRLTYSLHCFLFELAFERLLYRKSFEVGWPESIPWAVSLSLVNPCVCL